MNSSTFLDRSSLWGRFSVDLEGAAPENLLDKVKEALEYFKREIITAWKVGNETNGLDGGHGFQQVDIFVEPRRV